MTQKHQDYAQLEGEPPPHAGLAIVHDHIPARGAVVSLASVARIPFGRASRRTAHEPSSRPTPLRTGLADARTPTVHAELTCLGTRDATIGDGTARTVVAAGALERMDGVVDRVAHSLISVLILGETGAGKEVLARRIHERSSRAGRMVSINCAALSESLLESELFGHEMGAFTGALRKKAGLLESAEGGTVFLDEIGEMPLATQAKLLRALEQREVTRVGALRPLPIDARFIAATNRHIEEDVVSGRFRADLYFRINGITLSLPPLRERVDEIEPLARAFAEEVSRQMGMPQAPRFSAESLAMLQQRRWPGNIRELRNVIQRAVVLCGDGGLITPGHLVIDSIGPSRPASAEAQHPKAVPPPTRSAADGNGDHRARVVRALEQCAGNQAHAAKLLGISRGTLIKRIVDFGLPRPRKRIDPDA